MSKLEKGGTLVATTMADLMVATKGVEILDEVTVPVAVVASRTEAELIAGLLRSNGLRAVVSADDAGGQNPQMQLLGVRVLVAPADESAARRLLAEAEGQDTEDDPRNS